MSAFKDPEIEISVQDAAALLDSDEGARLVAMFERVVAHCDAGDVDACASLPGRAIPESALCDAGDFPSCHEPFDPARAKAFRASGYDAVSMAGGIEAWHDAGLPMDPPDGRVADH